MRPSLLLLCVSLACTSAKQSGRAGDPAASATSDHGMTATADTAPVTSIAGVSSASSAEMAAPTGTRFASPAAAPDAGAAASPTTAGASAPAAPAAPAGSALTASEAAAAYARAQRGDGSTQPGAAGAAAENNACETAADCAFTRVAAGACCPLLCAPRVVSKQQADALQRHINACRRGQVCPEPMCRQPPYALVPSCEQHQCVGKPGPAPRVDD